MYKRMSFLLTVTFLLLSSAGLALAETPHMMTYQGFLTDSAGPVSGSRAMVFSIYSIEEGGTPIWSTGTINVDVDSGYFYYMLGSDSTIPPECFEGPDRWLGIQILPDNEMTPRTRLTSVPYAYQTLRADTARVGGGWVADQDQKLRTEVYPADSYAFVGVGTTTPEAKLHVTGTLPGEDLIRAGDSTLVIPDSGPILVGRMLHIQNYDLGYFGGSCSDDIFVEDSLAVLGLYSAGGYGDLGSAVTFGQVIDGSFSDKWGIVRENYDDPYGGNGLRFTYGTGANQALNSTKVRIDPDGDVAIGTEDPGQHRLYVESSNGGANGRTAHFINTNTVDGRGIYVENNSSQLTMLVSQKGEQPNGEIFRCDSWTGAWHPVFTVKNNGRTIIRGILELQTAGGSTAIELGEGLDYAEGFDVSGDPGIEAGAVLVIDPAHPGELTLSARPYDRTVAGIAAGADGLGSGVRLGANQFDLDVALAGRVYCNVDASFGAIQPGDLLTTSSTPGYAMKVTDHARAQGAIIGKAMQPLDFGQKGRILVLVTLQ